MTAVVPRQATDEDIDQIRDLVRAGAVGPWHYRWPALKAVAARLGISPENAVYRTHDGRWSEYHTQPTTIADAIREATAR